LHPRFAEESTERVIVAKVRAQQLHGDLALDPGISCEPDLTHATATEHRAKLVAVTEIDRRGPA
jgi:hypothetical protein